MNASSRPLWAAVCLLTALLTGVPASAQFLGNDIIQAEQINAAARQRMSEVITPAIDDLNSGDPKAISEARKKLLGPLENISASPAFLDAFSEMISAKLDPAVNHDSVLVRMNAMIIISRLTDDGSLAHIDAGLEDKNVAVEHWAMRGLERRVEMWKARAEKDNGLNITDQLDAIQAKVIEKLGEDPAPQPIVVGPGLEALFEIGTQQSYEALITQLNKRVDLHANAPDLSFAGEQAAFQQFASAVSTDRTLNRQYSAPLNQVAYRFSMMILKQAKNDAIGEDSLNDALTMLDQSIRALGTVTAGAQVTVPAGQAQANDAIISRRWANLDKLLSDYAVVLRAAPFSLNNEQLGLQ